MKKITLFAIIALLMVGCVQNNPIKRIEKLEKEAFAGDGKVNPELANDLVNVYCDYAYEHPHDAKAPEYLFKAVDVSMNLNEPQRTIFIIDKLIQEYPEYPRTQAALFVKAFVFENKYGNLDMAKKLYEQYLEMYPDGEFAADCRASIENLGLTPEELVKKFEGQE